MTVSARLLLGYVSSQRLDTGNICNYLVDLASKYK